MSLLPLPDGYFPKLKKQGVRWDNFYRSAEKCQGSGNRYYAKCGYCLFSLDGKAENLHKHVMTCNKWPIAEKTLYLVNAVQEVEKSVVRKRPREVAEVERVSSPIQQTMHSYISRPLSSEKIAELHELLLKAIIYGGIAFIIGDNIFFKQFVHALCSTYIVPSNDVLRGCVLMDMFTKHLLKKLDYLPSFKDYTICFDGWTDVSDNSIYAFMLLKEEREDVLDILDLSDVRHTAIELQHQLLSDLLLHGAVVGNALACVTDSPSTMVKLRDDLQKLHPNVVSIRCVLHGFNSLAKDVAGFPGVVKVCKMNMKLVNYFTSSHFWKSALKKWQVERKIPHFLSTFCETRWYSLARVCLGVTAYEEGFRYCLELSKKPGYPPITNTEVCKGIGDRYHFAANGCLVEALKPIVDVIGNLEKRTTTLADVLWSFITLHHKAKNSEYIISGLNDHVLSSIGKRVKEFEDPIYLVALFLHPAHKKMAMSHKTKSDTIITSALGIAKDWHFEKRDVLLLYKELVNYQNGDAPYDELKETSKKSARDIWENFSGSNAVLRRFAMKLFAIVPHSAPCERLFSTLGLIKTKPRNRLAVEKLNMLAQIKCELVNQVCTKKKACGEENIQALVDEISMGDLDSVDEEDNGTDLLLEVVEVVSFTADPIAATVLESFFDFDVFERDNADIGANSNVNESAGSSRQQETEWTIADIMKECAR